jgi:hypothetical protein
LIDKDEQFRLMPEHQSDALRSVCFSYSVYCCALVVSSFWFIFLSELERGIFDLMYCVIGSHLVNN